MQVVTDIVRRATHAQHAKADHHGPPHHRIGGGAMSVDGSSRHSRPDGGRYSAPRLLPTLQRELLLALLVAVSLSALTFLRVRYVGQSTNLEALAITLSLACVHRHPPAHTQPHTPSPHCEALQLVCRLGVFGDLVVRLVQSS